MRFWDSSALVPLVLDEPASDEMRRLIREDGDAIVWMLSSVEVSSALARLERSSRGLDDLLSGVRRDALDRVRRCHAVTLVDAVRQRAERLVSVHAITAADALQLAAALVVSREQPETLEFVTLDKVLARAARLEGFPVVGV
ncbi:MAG: type II toxin-antitoxin system VapC family toxin [Acidobacteria bacterium]|nr:type II toxin-antitoxin system VapC family toxin [Acidobacteriota bacterium]